MKRMVEGQGLGAVVQGQAWLGTQRLQGLQKQEGRTCVSLRLTADAVLRACPTFSHLTPHGQPAQRYYPHSVKETRSYLCQVTKPVSGKAGTKPRPEGFILPP